MFSLVVCCLDIDIDGLLGCLWAWSFSTATYCLIGWLLMATCRLSVGAAPGQGVGCVLVLDVVLEVGKDSTRVMLSLWLSSVFVGCCALWNGWLLLVTAASLLLLLLWPLLLVLLLLLGGLIDVCLFDWLCWLCRWFAWLCVV